MEEVIGAMKENLFKIVPCQKEVAELRMNTLAAQPQKENRNMR